MFCPNIFIMFAVTNLQNWFIFAVKSSSAIVKSTGSAVVSQKLQCSESSPCPSFTKMGMYHGCQSSEFGSSISAFNLDYSAQKKPFKPFKKLNKFFVKNLNCTWVKVVSPLTSFLSTSIKGIPLCKVHVSIMTLIVSGSLHSSVVSGGKDSWIAWNRSSWLALSNSLEKYHSHQTKIKTHENNLQFNRFS